MTWRRTLTSAVALAAWWYGWSIVWSIVAYELGIGRHTLWSMVAVKLGAA